MWELDVAASSDGELVVMHDDSLARTTDAAARFPGREPWTVYDFSLAELRSLDAGSWYGQADPFGQARSGRVGASAIASFEGLRIPTLAEALDLTRALGFSVNVEIKDATGRACDGWIVERAVDAIRERGMAGATLVSSFNHDYLRRAKAAEPGLAVGALVDEAPPDTAGALRDLGAYSLNPGLELLSRAAVEEARAAGFEVFVWTVNEKDDMRRVIEWGASGIFTDFPDRLVEVLAEG